MSMGFTGLEKRPKAMGETRAESLRAGLEYAEPPRMSLQQDEDGPGMKTSCSPMTWRVGRDLWGG